MNNFLNGVQPQSTIQPGQAVQYIDSSGNQNFMTIVNQLLTGFSSGYGIVASTDSILAGLQKLSGAANTAYSATSTATSITLTAFQSVCIVTATGQTIKLPSSSATGVNPAVVYFIIFPAAATSPGTIGVTTGDSLNGAVNGTFAVPAVLTNNSPARAISTGSGWWTC